MITANQPFIIKKFDPEKKITEVFDNNKDGFSPVNDVTYIEIGEEPFSIRYSDYDKMFKGALTVIIQYTESPVEIIVESLDGKLSKTLTLGGTPGHQDTGVFRLYSVPEQ